MQEVKLFKPKKRFLSLVSNVNGTNVNITQNVGFLKGKYLSGMLDTSLFKITIHDDGIEFIEHIGNNTDEQMLSRLVDSITDMEAVSFNQKTVINELIFTDIDGNPCKLEVESVKPINRLREILSRRENKTNVKTETKTPIETKETTDFKKQVETPKINKLSEHFDNMKKEKLVELEKTVERLQKEFLIKKNEIANSESKLKEIKENIILNSKRIDNLKVVDESNDILYFVSEKLESESELSEDNIKLIGKISKLLNLNSEKLCEAMKKNVFSIKVANVDDFESDVDEKYIIDIKKIDIDGEFKITDKNTIQYMGELGWNDIINKMDKLGFMQNPEFNKHCGSNSYNITE